MKSLDLLAAERMAAGTAAGLSATPWLEGSGDACVAPTRDFFIEAAEELADAKNYISFLQAQLDPGAVLSLDFLEHAQRAVALAYHDLQMAEKIRLETGGR